MDALTRNLMPETRAILLELAALVHRAVPEATEEVKPGWRSLNFRHPDVGYFCGLFPREDRVVVEFGFGVLLPDPDGILEANNCAKQVRLVRVRSRGGPPRAALKRLFQEAASLPRERSARIALAKSGAKLVLPNSSPKKRTLPKRPLR
ncbi:MAG: DUF1801 domain-containing protein [Anaerolineales bacterium]